MQWNELPLPDFWSKARGLNAWDIALLFQILTVKDNTSSRDTGLPNDDDVMPCDEIPAYWSEYGSDRPDWYPDLYSELRFSAPK